jgi:hypothetical protein
MALVNATESIVRHQAVAGTSASQLVAANPERSSIEVRLDPAASGIVYLLLASSGTPGPTNFDVAVTATLGWDGLVGLTVWRGAVQMISTVAAQNITAAEVAQ